MVVAKQKNNTTQTEWHFIRRLALRRSTRGFYSTYFISCHVQYLLITSFGIVWNAHCTKSKIWTSTHTSVRVHFLGASAQQVGWMDQVRLLRHAKGHQLRILYKHFYRSNLLTKTDQTRPSRIKTKTNKRPLTKKDVSSGFLTLTTYERCIFKQKAKNPAEQAILTVFWSTIIKGFHCWVLVKTPCNLVHRIMMQKEQVDPNLS